MADKPLRSVVYDYILDLIFKHELQSGQKISEDSLAKALNMSRTPIREALRELEFAGIVEILPKRYAKIAEITERDLSDMSTLKLALEALTCQLVLFRVSNEDIYELVEINKELEEAMAQNDTFKAMKCDIKFHNFYNSITQNPYLMEAQSKIRGKNLLYQSMLLKDDPDLIKDSSEQHKEIINALLERDYDQLLRVSLGHITKFYNSKIDAYTFTYQDFSKGIEDVSKFGQKIK